MMEGSNAPLSRTSLILIAAILLLPIPALAERYICPVKLQDEALLQLARDGDRFVLTHSALGTRNAAIVGENETHVCTSTTLLNEEDPPTIYLFCVDKQLRTIAVTFGTPFGDEGMMSGSAAEPADESGLPDRVIPLMEPWTHARCFVSTEPE